MQKPELVKYFFHTICPNCSKEIFPCVSYIPPGFAYCLSAEEVAQNKRRLREALKNIEFKSKDEEKETIAYYIDSEDFVFGGEDIDNILKIITQEQKE